MAINIVTFAYGGSRYVFVIPVTRLIDVFNSIVSGPNYVHITFSTYPLLHYSDNSKAFVTLKVREATQAFSTSIRTIIPHNSEEIGFAEIFNRASMNGVGRLFVTANILQTYWLFLLFSVRDIAFKINDILVHRCTRTSPFAQWHYRKVKPPTMFSFGQLGCIPILPRSDKRTNLSTMGRCMGMCCMRHVKIQLPNSNNTRCRSSEFHRVHGTTDPTRTDRMDFSTHSQRIIQVPVNIAPGNSSSLHIKHASRFPDAMYYMTVYHTAFEKLGQEYFGPFNVHVA